MALSRAVFARPLANAGDPSSSRFILQELDLGAVRLNLDVAASHQFFAFMSQMPSPDQNPESWLDDHGDAMFRYAVMRIRDNSAAEDLVQEAFVSALKSVESFHGHSSVRTWLISILRHKIMDYLRWKQRKLPTPTDLNQAAAPREESLKHWPADPATIFEQKEFWAVFQRCTGKLPDGLADAYYLRELVGMTTDEICQELNITSNSLAIRIHRARVELRKCLDRNWFHADR